MKNYNELKCYYNEKFIKSTKFSVMRLIVMSYRRTMNEEKSLFSHWGRTSLVSLISLKTNEFNGFDTRGFLKN